jgi:hypothetical protein
MRICLIDTGDGVNFREHQLGQCVLVGNLNDGEDVGLSPTGVDLFDFLYIPKGFDDISGLAGMNVDQYVGSVRHGVNLP